MSGIGNIGSTPNLLQYLQNEKLEEDDSTIESSSVFSPPTEAQREAHLDQALFDAGVSDATASAIKSELKAAFEEIQASGEFPPNRETMKATVDEIFSKYGLDADSVFGDRAISSSTTSIPQFGSSEKSPQDLVGLLTSLGKNARSPSELAQLLSDAINGVDLAG